ncbi:hypothetical protein PCIT_b0805 [Pseudoalteromonas citrea]|uniref:Uncharacterized protein n=1 Tax=Pseudoalteromonas citrea TaxID=43655 RepID=A0AAD4FQ77_9GAMM|nr:hypothetical protein PCIT_b0805 [Pseudoalteromonas citrea]
MSVKIELVLVKIVNGPNFVLIKQFVMCFGKLRKDLLF